MRSQGEIIGSATPRRRVVVRAFGKINLELRLLGRRPDGFHEVRTLLQALELHDTVTCVRRRGPFRLTCRHPEVPANATNLAWRAAEGLWRATGRSGEPRDVSIKIDKRLPVRAGLGGGSADAAATLVGLCHLWGIGLDRGALHPLAANLGSDVPFFLWGGAALGLGRGDEVYPLADLPRRWVVVVTPAFGVTTAEAYAWYDEARPLARVSEAPYAPRVWMEDPGHLTNDLEGPIARRFPDVVVLKGALRAQGALAAAMTGSGSAVFGLFRRRAEALAALTALEQGGWRGVLTRTLTRLTYRRRLVD